MKNNLTSAEWLALAEFIESGQTSRIASPMLSDQTDQQEILCQAKKKFLETADKIRGVTNGQK